MPGTPRLPRLPAQPLAERIEQRGGWQELGGDHDYSWRENVRGRCERIAEHASGGGTLDVFYIDRFCIEVLGVNPTAVYGWDFLAVEEGEEVAA